MERSAVLVVAGFLNSLYLFLFLLESCADAQGSSSDVCPLLRTDIQSQLSESNRERVFLNFGAPAQCNGTVTSWRYCSYNTYSSGSIDDSVDDDGCGSAQSYTSKFLVYRQTASTTYEAVPGSTKSVTITLSCPSDGGFRCRVATLSQSEQFTIQPNDIVAACLMDTGSTDPLRIVGEGSTQSGSGKVYHYDVSGYQSCTTSELQSIDTQRSEFTSRNGIYRLHLYAEVSSQNSVAQCSGGSNPPPFTPSVVSGTYLNTASPISCSDTITSWHYCYYPSAAADSQLTYTATVGVWRLNTALNQYELLPGSDHTLELVQPASTLAKIFCKTEVLEPSEYVRVQTGDVIGVSLPTANPLPILASGATGYSLVMNGTLNAPATVLLADLDEASSLTLHLYPTIGFVPMEPPTTEQSTSPPVTTHVESPVSDSTDGPNDGPQTVGEGNNSFGTRGDETTESVTPASSSGITESADIHEANDTTDVLFIGVSISIIIIIGSIVAIIIVVVIIVWKNKKNTRKMAFDGQVNTTSLTRGSLETSADYDYINDDLIPHMADLNNVSIIPAIQLQSEDEKNSTDTSSLTTDQNIAYNAFKGIHGGETTSVEEVTSSLTTGSNIAYNAFNKHDGEQQARTVSERKQDSRARMSDYLDYDDVTN